MAFQCILFVRVLILDFGIFSLLSLFMECLCIAPLSPVVMVMIRGLVFHSLFCMMLSSGSYLVCLCVRAITPTYLKSGTTTPYQPTTLHMN